MPSARRVVVFFDNTTFWPRGRRVYKSPSALDVDELVLHFYPLHPALLFTVLCPNYGLLSFTARKVTVIFRDDGPAGHTSWFRPNAADMLARLIVRLPTGAVVTVVGFEVIAEHPDYDRYQVEQDLESHSDLSEVEFVDLRTYQERVGAETWALYSERPPERPVRELSRRYKAHASQAFDIQPVGEGTDQDLNSPRCTGQVGGSRLSHHRCIRGRHGLILCLRRGEVR